MITLSHLKKTYGGVTALDIPELTIEAGQVVGLVGNNGAGKTTMMRLILDLIRADRGTVTLDGTRVDLYPGWKAFTGSFLDGSFLIDFYTPEEFFDFIAEAYGFSQEELANRLLLLEKGHLLMDKAHVPGSVDPELEAYFLDAVK